MTKTLTAVALCLLSTGAMAKAPPRLERTIIDRDPQGRVVSRTDLYDDGCDTKRDAKGRVLSHNCICLP